MRPTPPLLALALATGCVADDAADEAVTTAAATATASVTDDAYVASQFAADVHASQPYLVLGTAAANQHHAYLKLAVSGIPAGATQLRATLALTPQTSAANAIHAHCGPSTWSGATLTWANQPGFAAPIVATAATQTAGAPIQLDVTACVTGNGTFTVVLDQPTGGVLKLNSSRSTTPPTIAVSFTPAACTGFDPATLVPCANRRWEGASPSLNGVDVADLQAFEAMQGAQLGVVHFFRTPGSDLWGPAGGFQEQTYLNTAAPVASPRHLYIGYRPNADWSLFDGVGSDDAATIARIRSDARRTIALFNQAHRKLWINAVNHEAERYVTGCGGNNASNPHNTIATYHAAWRNVIALFNAELAAAGLPTTPGSPNYPIVWAINTQNIVKATNPATCKDAAGNGLTSFRQVMLALAPRSPSGALLVQWFGWNPYTPGGGRALADVMDDGYDFLVASAPADLKALPWHFGEFGYLGDPPIITAAKATPQFNDIAAKMTAGRWPNVRLMLYFDAVAAQDPNSVGFGAAFKTYATSATMLR
jgi:hypothetical protein